MLGRLGLQQLRFTLAMLETKSIGPYTGRISPEGKTQSSVCCLLRYKPRVRMTRWHRRCNAAAVAASADAMHTLLCSQRCHRRVCIACVLAVGNELLLVDRSLWRTMEVLKHLEWNVYWMQKYRWTRYWRYLYSLVRAPAAGRSHLFYELNVMTSYRCKGLESRHLFLCMQ